MRIGVIGTGTIGGMLAAAFAESAQVTVYNRTWQKAADLARACDNVRIAPSLEELVRSSQVLFLCTKACDGRQVLRDIGGMLSPGQVLATTISQVPIGDWEAGTAAAVAKVIPSITQLERSGIVLVSYGSRFGADDMETFEALLRRIGTPFVVDEAQLRVCSDLTSCGPAFLAFLVEAWARAAAKQAVANRSGLSVAEAEHLLCMTIRGVTELLARGMSPREIVERVRVPGGVTDAGLNAIANDALRLFQRLHEATANHPNGIAAASTVGH